MEGVIDCHAHCVPIGLVEAATLDPWRHGVWIEQLEGAQWFRFGRGPRLRPLFDRMTDETIEGRLADMDDQGVGTQVLPGVATKTRKARTT